MFNRVFQITAVAALLGCATAMATPSYVVPPGLIGGEPGTTIGWGFSITNDTGFFLLVDSSQFCQPGQDPQFTTCTQQFGTYTDLIATDVTIIGPGATLTETYNPTGDPNTQSGLGSYSIDPAAPLLAIDTGVIVLTYQEFTGNPLIGGTQESGDIELGLNDLAGGGSSGAAAVEVTPEPATLALVTLGLTAGVLFRRLREQR